jgi:hypothetical protein
MAGFRILYNPVKDLLPLPPRMMQGLPIWPVCSLSTKFDLQPIQTNSIIHTQ